MHSQPAIFALGDAAYIYLEFALLPSIEPRTLIETVANIHEPRTTVGGVNFAVGVRPSLWRALAPDATPADARDFDRPYVGPDGFTMPATQCDLWLYLSGATYDIVWESARGAIAALRKVATLATDIDGWSYRHSRDLTGFEDGTENPSLMEAPDVALVAAGEPGEGASILLFQKWRHEETWEALSTQQQELVMGRTKAKSIEFPEDRMPGDSHVSRAKDIVNGEERDIFRRNTPYGNVREFGTVFVGFSAQQSRLDRMLMRMAGIEGGIRDALTRYTTPLTGAYYVIPSITALMRFATETGSG
ncbi:MAG: Dyp-type peroxidase [Candidatus Eremiobacteraeota bacterium]|nr:Dyp-type peroxidase [Candidatus Eremiobacteraeota bacterium]